MAEQKYKLEELNPYQRNLLVVYSRRYRMSIEELLEQLNKTPGDTFVEKLMNWESERRGLVVDAWLRDDVRRFTASFDTDDGTVKVPKLVFPVIMKSPQSVAEALGLELDVVSQPDIAVLIRAQDLASKLVQLPVGTVLTFGSVRATRGTKTGNWYFNASWVRPQAVDYEFLDRESYTVDMLDNVVFQEDGRYLIKIDRIFAVDPTYTMTSSGKPAVRVYLSENIQLDFYGDAATVLKQYIGDPYLASAWEGKTVYVFATYSGQSLDIDRFRIFAKQHVIPRR